MIEILTAAHCETLIAEIAAGVLVEDAVGRVLLINDTFRTMFRLSEDIEAYVGRSSLAVFEAAAGTTFLDPPGFVRGITELHERKSEVLREPFTTIDDRSLERDVRPVATRAGHAGFVWIFRDVSDSVVSEAMARQKAFFDAVLEALPAQLAVFSPTGVYEYITPSAIRDPETRKWIIGRTDIEYGILRGLPREVTEQRRERIKAVVESKQTTEFEESFPTKEGELRHFRRYSTPIFDEQGEVRYILGYGLDITVQRRVEQQLLQSQKMDAVGRLAGGVAHDFNNLLTVINGFTEALRDELPPDDDRRSLVDPILQASRRAAELTSQLLAFSRQAIVETRVLDLNSVVEETTTMLRRLVGESIDMKVQLEPGTHTVRAGSGQLQQVLLNLAVNARDAMPSGGALLVETARMDLTDPTRAAVYGVRAGPYVELRVTDTGTGMTDEVRGRLFEPFFTTKEVGRGTGLGLSTVYGIVMDAGGQILVESEVGRGSTFRVLLPAFQERRTAPRADTRPDPVPRGTETVLVAEDERGVRELVFRILNGLGYTVLLATDGRDALAVAERYGRHIDLLLTDVVMPQMHGSALADALTAIRPDLKVLFMSGYTDDDVLRHGVASATTAFMQKPFTVPVLARRVRDTLDGRA